MALLSRLGGNIIIYSVLLIVMLVSSPSISSAISVTLFCTYGFFHHLLLDELQKKGVEVDKKKTRGFGYEIELYLLADKSIKTTRMRMLFVITLLSLSLFIIYILKGVFFTLLSAG